VSALSITEHASLLDVIAGTSTLYRPTATAVSGTEISGNIAGNAAGFTGNLAGDVTGAQGATVVARIQGRNVDTAAPADGQVLKWSAGNTRWEPAADATGGGGGTLAGDVTGPIATSKVEKIQGVNVSATAPTTGQVLVMNGSSTWTPVTFGVDNLVSKVTGTAQFLSASCTSAQTLTWSSLSDSFSCSNISLGSANISFPLLANPVGSAGAPAYSFTGTDSDSGIFSPAADTVSVSTAGVERVRINAAGWVGIGVTTASSPLHLNGIMTLGQTGVTKSIQIIPDSGGVSYIRVGTNNLDATGELRFSRYGNSAGAFAVLSSYATTNYFSGNVGVGTATPQSKLDVNGIIRATDICDETGANCKDISTGWAGGGGDFKADGTVPMSGVLRIIDGNNATPGLAFGADLNTGIFRLNADEVSIAAGGNNRLQIGSSVVRSNSVPLEGTVSGAGITTALRTMNYENAAVGNGGRIDFSVVDSASSTNIPAAIAGVNEDPTQSTFSGSLRFLTKINNVLGERMRVHSDGNVGIGTTSPSQKLHVEGTTGATLKIVDGNQAAGRVLTSDANGIASWADAASAGGLTNFTESVSVASPHDATHPVVRLAVNNGATDATIALSAKGTGALVAQVADGAATGGNKRGEGAVDWQMARVAATAVASGQRSTVSGGNNNTAGGSHSTASGGASNAASGGFSTVSGGQFNTASGTSYATVSGGQSNTASGSYSNISGGVDNVASGAYASIAGGGNNDATGNYSSVPGGGYNTASGRFSLAANYTTTADSFAQTTFGQFNAPKGGENATSWVSTDPLFVVGHGTSAGAKSNALMILKSGNVGIGSTNPASKLDVAGTIRANEICDESGANCKDISTGWASGSGDFKADGTVAMTGQFQASSGNNGAPGISFSADPDSGFYHSGAADEIQIALGGASKYRVAPDFIDGTFSGSFNLRRQSPSAANPTYGFSGYSGGIYAPATDEVSIATASTDRMRISASGNVGVGTTNPQSKLDVAGTIRANEICDEAGANCQDISAGWPTGTPTATGVGGNYLKSNGTTWAADVIRFSDIKNAAGTASAFNVGACAANQTVAWSSLTDSFGCQDIGSLDATKITTGTLDINRLPSSITDGVWTASSGNVYRSTGNVGIGTTNPTRALDIQAATASMQVKSNSTNYAYLNLINSGATSLFALESNAGGALLGGTLPYSTLVQGSNALHLASNGGVRMTLDTVGNIGIGTTNPGTMRTLIQGTTNTTLFGVSDGTATFGVFAYAGNDPADAVQFGSYSNHNLGVYTNNGTPQASFNTNGGTTIGTYANTSTFATGPANGLAVSGNVGIGTATPRAVLDVNGTIVGKPAVSNASATINFGTGNTQYTAQNCQAYILHNLKDGGTYSFYVQGTTSTTCSFTAFSGAGTGALTVRMPIDHSATYVGYHTVYQFAVVGTTVYVSWLTGI
jgi:hypothetical protein